MVQYCTDFSPFVTFFPSYMCWWCCTKNLLVNALIASRFPRLHVVFTENNDLSANTCKLPPDLKQNLEKVQQFVSRSWVSLPLVKRLMSHHPSIQTVGYRGNLLAASCNKVFSAALSLCPVTAGHSQQAPTKWSGNTHFSLASGGWQWGPRPMWLGQSCFNVCAAASKLCRCLLTELRVKANVCHSKIGQ